VVEIQGVDPAVAQMPPEIKVCREDWIWAVSETQNCGVRQAESQKRAIRRGVRACDEPLLEDIDDGRQEPEALFPGWILELTNKVAHLGQDVRSRHNSREARNQMLQGIKVLFREHRSPRELHYPVGVQSPDDQQKQQVGVQNNRGTLVFGNDGRKVFKQFV